MGNELEPFVFEKSNRKEINRIINKIMETRTKNNKNWMALLALAFEYAPTEAKLIVNEISKYDQEIVELTKKLAE